MRVFVITTGRSGTRSMTGFLNTLLKGAGLEGTARDHTSVFDLIRVGLDRLVDKHYDPSRTVALLRSWTHEAEVNPGPSFVLPEVLAAWGPDMPVIHLLRERQACVESYTKHIKTGPERWGNFVDHPGPFVVHRPTAVHFGEMGQAEWDALALHDKVAWMYDAHLRETQKMLPQFRRTMTVATETLNTSETQRQIARFLELSYGADAHMPWIGRTKDASYEGVSGRQAETFEINFQHLDWNRVVRDPYYPFLHFLYIEIARHNRDPSDPVRKHNLIHARKMIDEVLARNG